MSKTSTTLLFENLSNPHKKIAVLFYQPTQKQQYCLKFYPDFIQKNIK